MKKILSLLSLTLLLLGAYLVLITPGNPFTHLFRAKISDTDAKVIVGPYPLEQDFKLLAQNGVTTAVSLLNPALPYEKTLLDQERVLAEKYGLKLLNFPMTSILGQKMGADYEKNREAAAEAIFQAEGKVYLHCYLGIHRAAQVKELAEAKGAKFGTYTVRGKGERSEAALALDEAEKAFAEKQYQTALQKLSRISSPEPNARLLQAWCYFRLQEIEKARHAFASLTRDLPNLAAAHNGLGYCALRTNDLKEAEQQFSAALKDNSEDASNLVGLGIVCQRQGKNTEAREYFTQALKIQPDNAEAKELLAKVTGP
jgi:Flp pilus assembly protein TadD